MKWKGRRLLAMALTGILLAGCGAAGQVDDYATNEGSTQEASTKTTGTESGGISKDKIKVGVLHLSDPAVDIPIRMILAFRQCSRILDYQMNRLTEK